MPSSGHPRGAGSLWAFGLNYSLTGVFYNKTLAAKIGMTTPPATLAQFDALLAKTKAGGVTPIVQFNGGATGGLLFPLQQLMGVYGAPTPINNWIFQKPGAKIDTASNLAAAQHLQGWIKAGYFNTDANATDYPTMMSKFQHGEGVFMFDGDWESGNLDKLMPGNVGFFLMPTLKAGGKHTAMSAPLTYGIAAKAKHADCAAFFFNWIATNPKARKIDVAVGGSNPGGPANLPIPVPKPGTVTAQTLAAGKVVATANGAMDFIANATQAIYAQSWTPEVQKLFAGQETPDGRAFERPVGLRAAGEERRLVQDQSLHAAGRRLDAAQIQRGTTSVSVADPPGEGPRRAPAGLAVRGSRRSRRMRVFVLWPLIQTFKYSLYQWDGVLPARWVGLDNFKTVFTDHELLGVLGHAFQLIIFFSGIPVAARPRGRNGDATRRLSTGQQRRTCGVVPAAGRAAGRRRNRMELGVVLNGRCQPGAQGRWPGRRDPSLAR